MRIEILACTVFQMIQSPAGPSPMMVNVPGPQMNVSNDPLQGYPVGPMGMWIPEFVCLATLLRFLRNTRSYHIPSSARSSTYEYVMYKHILFVTFAVFEIWYFCDKTTTASVVYPTRYSTLLRGAECTMKLDADYPREPESRFVQNKFIYVLAEVWYSNRIVIMALIFLTAFIRFAELDICSLFSRRVLK